jgi:hypothetical protein
MAAEFALVLFLNSVYISIDQAGGLSATQLAVAVDQMHQIWSGAGVNVTASVPEEPGRPDQAVVSLRIVRFAAPTTARGEPILAWVAVGEAHLPAPALFVSLQTMNALLANAEFAGYPMKRLTSAVRAELTGRAIGRAAAHELGHYLLQRAGHRVQGLMRPSYSITDLVGDWLEPFQVVAEQWPTVRTEIAALARAQHAF